MDGFSWLPRLALKRPVSVFMALAAILVLGAVSYAQLQMELMPSGGREPRMWLQTRYPNATATDILEQILEPVEEELRTIPRLESIRSRATHERASLSLRFHRGTNLDEAYMNVREKLERLRPELPDDFDRFTVWRWDNRSRPIFWMRAGVVTGAENSASTVLDRMQEALQRLPGVAKVDFHGRSEQEVAVLIDPETAESLGADPFSVVEALRRNNFSMAVGTLEESGRTLLVRAFSRLDNLEDLRQLSLTSPPGGGGGPFAAPTLVVGSTVGGSAAADGVAPGGGGDATRRLRIADVARVELREQERENWSKFAGRHAVMIAVFKEDTANTIDVGRAVRNALEQDFPKDPILRDGELRILFAEDKVISSSLASLQQTALWGALFATIILFVFLRRVVPTLLVMTAIPISVLMTLIAMFFLGVSINIISLTGLMLALGMLVDNSVVVTENIARMRAAGMDPAEAAVRGTGEVGMAILMGTLTTVIVFVPLPFLGGKAFLSFIFGHLSFPITISLLSSLVVATFFVPLAARHLLGRKPTTEPRWFSSLREGYRNTLRWMLAHKLDSVVLLALLFATVWIPANNLKFNVFGSNSMRRVRVNFTLSPVYNLADTEAYFDRTLERLDGSKGMLGIRFTLVRFRRGSGTVSLFMKPVHEQPLTQKAFFREVRGLIGEEPGVTYSLRDHGDRDFERLLTVRLLGPKPEQLMELARRAREELSVVEGLGELDFEDERPPHEVAVVINRPLARQHGVTAREAARRIAGALRGTRALPRFRLGEEEIEVVVQQDSGRVGFEALTALRFQGSKGMVPFDSVASIRFRGAPQAIRRINGKVSLALEAPLMGNDFAEVDEQVRRIMDRLPFPTGYSWESGEEGRRMREDRGSLVVALALALVAVFMVMGVLFESFLLPLTVLVTIPLALFGSAWLMFLTETPMDTTGMIGIVILAGVVVNNGIVMVDRINRERRAGRPLEEAIVEAGGVRLRPILMTALTTIFGLLPMALGYTTVAGFSFVSLGRVVSGGLLAATLLTLFVVPLTYYGLVRIETTIREIAGRA